MNKENSIEVRNIKKSFRVYFDKGTQLKEKILFRSRNRYENREVLKGISFDVKKGEAVGLIGHNGCGKSTTLKLLTKIIYPDEGTIDMKGRVSSLIELGAGFHPDMSGRENIYTNASIFGLSKKEIDSRIQDIIDFSEIEEFIDNPVRTYSSGMYMRLAFSVAINVDADILLIDEILGVGDAGFQTKCFNKLKEIKSNGTTIVIVSHAMGQIEQICDRSIWIHEGVIKAEGAPREVHPMYMDYMAEERRRIDEKERKKQEALAEQKEAEQKEIEKKAEQTKPEIVKENVQPEETADTVAQPEPARDPNRWGSFDARIEKVKMQNEKGEPVVSLFTGDDALISVAYTTKKKVKDAIFGIGIFRVDNVQCYGTNTMLEDCGAIDLDGDGAFSINLKDICLLPGKYKLDVAIESGNSIPVDYWRNALEFTVYSKGRDVGVCRINHEWNL